MKKLISVLVGIAIFLLIIFKVDGAIVDFIANAIPKSAAEWIPLIRIALWITIVCISFGIAVWLAVIAGIIVNAILEGVGRRKATRYFGQPQKSRFQQRLEEMAKNKGKL